MRILAFLLDPHAIRKILPTSLAGPGPRPAARPRRSPAAFARPLELCDRAATRRSGEPFGPDELLARLLMHIPAPRLHVARYYGHYAHVSRARRRQAGSEGQPTIDALASADDDES